MRSHTPSLSRGLAGALLAVFAWTAAAGAQTVTLTNLGTLGGTQAQAYAVNDAGEVVGWSNRPGSGTHIATLWSNGDVVDLAAMCAFCFGISEAYDINDSGQAAGWSSAGAVRWNLTAGTATRLAPLPGDSFSQAHAINNHGQVVGQSYGPASGWKAVLWEAGATSPVWLGVLGVPPGRLIDSNAHDINDLGQVVGTSITAIGARHAFLWHNGVMTDLGTGPPPRPGCGSGDSWAGGINRFGEVSGYSKFGCATYAAKWVNGIIQALPAPGGNTSEATFHTINDAGDVSGTATGWCGRHAVIWRNESIIDLGALPGSCWSHGFGISNRGQVAGFGYDKTGNFTSALLWSTEPPDTEAPDITVPESFAVEATDPDGSVVSWTASAADTKDGNVPVTCTPASPALLPLGRHTVECTASDAAGNEATASFVVTVEDTTAPAIDTIVPSTQVLWPPNHKLVDVAFEYHATDLVSSPTCRLAVVSNESVDAVGDGHTTPDWVILSETMLQLRAERAGTGSGRMYSVTVTCSDEAGNTSAAATSISVPRSMGR